MGGGIFVPLWVLGMGIAVGPSNRVIVGIDGQNRAVVV